MYPHLAFLSMEVSLTLKREDAVWMINKLYEMAEFEIRQFSGQTQNSRLIRDFTLEAEALLGQAVNRIVASHMEFVNMQTNLLVI